MKIKYQFTALVVIALGFFSGSSLLTEFLSDRGFQKFQKGIAFTGYSRQAYASPAAVYPSGILTDQSQLDQPPGYRLSG